MIVQHPEWFLNIVEPKLWAVTDFGYGLYVLYSAVAEVQPQGSCLITIGETGPTVMCSLLIN